MHQMQKQKSSIGLNQSEIVTNWEPLSDKQNRLEHLSGSEAGEKNMGKSSWALWLNLGAVPNYFLGYLSTFFYTIRRLLWLVKLLIFFLLSSFKFGLLSA